MASLDDPSIFEPATVVFMKAAQGWDTIDSHLQ